MRIEPIRPQDHLALRDVRLRALQEAPTAFGSTYARESAWDTAAWREKAAFWDGLKAQGFLAWDTTDSSGAPCGIAGCLLHPPNPPTSPPTAQLVSVWIDPRQRGRGLARRLVEHCAEWATDRGAGRLLLTVTSNNQGAIRLYERLGFEATERIHPYRNDPALHEVEMVKPLRSSKTPRTETS